MPQEEDDALDKIVHDRNLQRDEIIPEDSEDTQSIPRPSDDGDADADMEEPVLGSHETN